MLLDFKVGGFCSFKEMQEVYLTPYSGTRINGTKYEDNFITSGKNKVMKSAILFGSNASGKTNFLMALEKFQVIVLGKGRLLDVIEESKINHNSNFIEFEINILGNDNKTYSYYLKFDRISLLEERLVKNGRLIFEFSKNKLKAGSRKITEEHVAVFSVKSTETIIKKLWDFNIPEIEKFVEALGSVKVIRENIYNFVAKEITKEIDEEEKSLLTLKKEKVLSVLELLDYTIIDFGFNRIGDRNNKTFYELFFKRVGSDKYYSLGNESEGIKKIVHLMKDILEIYNGKSVFIDELDSSISTKSLIKIFNNIINSPENKSGQLVVTSHNIMLFDNNIFEPQQIYIVNKEKSLDSSIYPLSDFEIRTEKQNLYIDYLKGKFGGMNG
jgi:AAA15 family ATPase/GTPase